MIVYEAFFLEYLRILTSVKGMTLWGTIVTCRQLDVRRLRHVGYLL